MNNTLIIAFSDFNYINVLNKWISYIKKVNIDNYLIISLDEEIHSYLLTNKIKTVLEEFKGTTKELWSFRLKIIEKYIKSGTNVIHSDIDAFWLKNPTEEYFLNNDFDIISSQGTVQPPDVLEKQGFVFCCGLMYFKSNNAVINFFKSWINLSNKLQSDQISFNRLIESKKMTWNKLTPDYILTYNNLKFNCYNDIIYAKNSELKIGLLPHKHFQRLFEPNKPYIAHLLSQKNEASKLNAVMKIKQYDKTFTKKTNQNKNQNSLVWLASYPRSGNTMLRIILNHNFDLQSYSIYNDKHDIAKCSSVAKIVGHQHLNIDPTVIINSHWPKNNQSFDLLRQKVNGLNLIKTHAKYHDNFANDKCIYVYRDGRATLRSFASYKINILKSKLNEADIIKQLIITGDNVFGYWHEHYLSWNLHDNQKIIYLQFEDIVKNPLYNMEKISNFLNVKLQNTNSIPFAQLNALCPNFFRKGTTQSWRDVFTDEINNLFWFFNSETMHKLKYTNKHSTLENILKHNSKYEYVKDTSEEKNLVTNLVIQICKNIIKYTLKMSKNDKSHVLNILTNKQPELFLYYKTRDLPYTDCMNIILETLDFIKKDSFQ